MRTAAVAAVLLVSCVSAASAATWSMKFQNFATLAMSIDCDGPTNCMAPVVNDQNGTDILFSKDQGNTWSAVGEPYEMMLMSGAIKGNTAAAATPFNVIASSGGNLQNWTLSPKGFIWVQSQNVEPFADTCFGAVGGVDVKDPNFTHFGAAISCNSGKTWTFANASAAVTCSARYGAFPSKNVFYISSGNWPEVDEDRAARLRPDSPYHALSNRIHINKAEQRAEFQYASLRTAEEQAAIAASDNPYLAQLLKSTDGGQTWTSQFEDEGHFYFNQIGCSSETHCCAVGEADTDSPTPGMRIMCTFDGETWTETYQNTDPTLSGMALQFLSANHVFVGGASLRQQLIEGIFWESLDGGKTWTESFVKDAYPNEMTFGSDTMGLSTGFDLEGASCLLQYK